jgi:anti-anti-sigma factor
VHENLHFTAQRHRRDGAGVPQPEFLMFERIHSEPGLVRLHLRGGLDSEASTALRDSLAALATVQAREVVIDLSHVTFIDGSGLGALSFLFKRLSARGRRLTLAGVSGQPLAMLRHLGLAKIFGVDAGTTRHSILPAPRFAWAR